MSKGFTLLELLVVMAVIGLLAALSLPNFMSARERARDAQRKSDLIQIQKALELYKLDHQSPVAYPEADMLPQPGDRWESDLDPSVVYMNKMPGDLNNPYNYVVDNGTLAYKLQACLENAADPDGRPCEDGFGCNDGQDICYVVEQP